MVQATPLLLDAGFRRHECFPEGLIQVVEVRGVETDLGFGRDVILGGFIGGEAFEEGIEVVTAR